MAETTITRDMAEQEIAEWGEANDIDLSASGMDQNTALLYGMIKDRMVKCFMGGSMIVNDAGHIVYTISKRSEADAGVQVEIKAPTGAAYMGLDDYKADQLYHKYTALASAMTGQPVAWFSRLANFDHKVLIGFAQLFMSV